MILDIIEVYTPIIGGVPIEMLEYHLSNRSGETYTREEIGEEIKSLLQDKKITRNVVAYKTMR